MLGAGYQTGAVNGQHRYVWLQNVWCNVFSLNRVYRSSGPFYGFVLFVLLYIVLEDGFYGSKRVAIYLK